MNKRDKAKVLKDIGGALGVSELDSLFGEAIVPQAKLAAIELLKRQARQSFLRFMQILPPATNYAFGRHTLTMCNIFTEVLNSIRNGKSRYVVVVAPPRHGKSDLTSRRFPPWYLGNNPDHEVILATYGANLAIAMSRDARRVVRTKMYQDLFGISLSRESHSAMDWGVEGHKGKFHAVGIEGAVTGHGAHVLVVDDYIKDRTAAESEVIRDSIWEAFQNDLMTRLAPVHAVIINATRWHTDDLIGRIKLAMLADPNFPRFEIYRFPAWNDKTGWLFPERFSADWYNTQKASVGSYAWQALYQGDPHPRTGNMFQVDRIQFYYGEPPECSRWIRFWDLASTAKQRNKSNPDFNVGLKLGGIKMADGRIRLVVDDVIRGRWTAMKRQARILQTADTDGPDVVVGCEAVSGYKDQATILEELLSGMRDVQPYTPNKDKVLRATPIEPIIEAGNFYVRKSVWTDEFIAEMKLFPAVRHDDQVDGLTGGFAVLSKIGLTDDIWVA